MLAASRHKEEINMKIMTFICGFTLLANAYLIFMVIITRFSPFANASLDKQHKSDL